MEPDVARLRHRRREGTFLVRDGSPEPDPETSLAVIHGKLLADWLDRNRTFVRGRLLDVGCGNQPYRRWYQALVSSAVAVDYVSESELSARSAAERLPFRDAAFDTVLMTEVLEHVDDAQAAVHEAARVLRPGGHLLVSVPFLYPTHEAPYDFRRFTHYGLRALLVHASMEVVSVDAKGGIAALAAHYASLAARLGFASVRRYADPSMLDRRWARALVTGPQRLVAAVVRQDQGIGRMAEYVSLGYMAVARVPPTDPI